MTNRKRHQKANFAFQNSSQILIWLMLFCLNLAHTNFCNSQPQSAPDLVYCPLQKIWVKKTEPKTSQRFQPFAEICATDRLKNSLELELSLKTFRPLTERLVFDYLEKGDKIFDELARFTNAPQSQPLKQTASESAANNSFQDFGKHEFAKFNLPQQPRPPTFSENNSVRFSFQKAHSLEKISRNINPRSPPFFV